MNATYTARAYRNPGRHSFVITFRHPLKTENGRPGRKVCKGLGTDDEAKAKQMEEQVNAILGRPDLHSLAGREEAARTFDAAVIDIFYGDFDPAVTSHRAVREKLMELPTLEDGGYVRTLLLGITGAGKTTLLRRLIGSDAEHDRFPSTSVNRTTTCEIEVITGAKDFSAAVTFLSRHQTQQEVIESLSAAVIKAIQEGADQAVVAELLEQSDMRFRLKYILGGWDDGKTDEDDVFSFDASENQPSKSQQSTSRSKFITTALKKIRAIGAAARKEVESSRGEFSTLKGSALDDAIDEAQSIATEKDEFLDLVNDVMDEIAARFDGAIGGKPVKSSTGWWDAWTLTMPNQQRDNFLSAVRSFCGTARDQWGSLLTPLVTGIRVRGPFRPEWVAEGEEYRHVFIDTEGLLHARMTADVPDELTSLFNDVDNVLLVESAKNALSSPVAGKVFEAMGSAGYTSKFALLFTHMDTVSGDNLSTTASRREHVFGGVRNVLDNQVARIVSRDAARRLATHLETNTFYFDYLDPKRYPTADQEKIAKFESLLGDKLWRLTEHFVARQAIRLQPASPKYSLERFGIAVRESSLQFQDEWDARLGYKRVADYEPAAWQSIKAMAHHLAEGWFGRAKLRPIDTLTAKTRNVLAKLLEAPSAWEPPGKELTDDEKAAIIDRIKQEVDKLLKELSKKRLWKDPQARWQDAYQRPIGVVGGTRIRRHLVHDIFGLQVPVPEVSGDSWTDEWIDDIKSIVERAVEIVKAQQKAQKQKAARA